MSQSPHPARKAALQLMNAVTEEGRLLSELTQSDWFLKLAPADRARANRLATETLRNLDRADRVLKPFLRKDPPEAVRAILRLGVVEVAALDGAPHGVVGDMVAAAAGNKRTLALKGMVNAVLRRTLEATEGNWSKKPVPQLPKWLRAPLIAAYGNGGVQALESAHLRGAPLDLTAKSDPEGLAKRLDGLLLETGTIRLRQGGQVSALPGFEEGDWWVQDAAAALRFKCCGLKKASALQIFATRRAARPCSLLPGARMLRP
ncbi:MAG: transcription antitermination factor NusB, partial [Pseudomonadota bacterium]